MMRAALIILILPLLSACASMIAPDVARMFNREEINYIETNYGAADYLAGYAHKSLTKTQTIEVGTLKDSTAPERITAFAKLVPEQVGTRFAQLGYLVQLDKIETYEGVREPKFSKNPDILITGNYLPSDRIVTVSLRLIDLRSAQIIAAYDYELPRTVEVEKILEPQIIMAQGAQ